MEELFFKLFDNLANQPQMLFLLAIEGMNHYYKKGAANAANDLLKMKDLKWPKAIVILGQSFFRSIPSILIASTLFL